MYVPRTRPLWPVGLVLKYQSADFLSGAAQLVRYLPGVGLLELLPGTEEAIDPEVPLDVLRPPGPGCCQKAQRFLNADTN